MKKTTILITFLLCCLMMRAQNVQEPHGPIVNNFNVEVAGECVMIDDADQLVAYCGPVRETLKRGYHFIVKYDKKRNTIVQTPLTLDKDYLRVMAFDAGDSYFVSYMRYPKRTEFEYTTAFIPKNCQNDYTVRPKVSTTFGVDFSGGAESFSSVSPDKQRYAVVFVVLNKKNMAEKFLFFVYDAQGNELYTQALSPEIYGDSFSMEDVQVNNDGEVVVLMRTGTKERRNINNSAVHLLVCNATGGQSFVEPTDFGIAQSMRLLQLQNGNLFVGGYYTNEPSAPTVGYFNYIFDTKEETFSEAHSYQLSPNQQPKHQLDLLGYFVYNTDCGALHELPTGEVVMIGEHRCAIAVQNGPGVATYSHFADDIVYQYFDKNGEMEQNRTIRKNQGKNFPYYAGYEGNNNFTFSKIGISFSSFVHDGQVYILYLDSQENFNSSNKKRAEPTKPGKSCFVLAKMDPDGADRQIIMIPGKSKRTIHELWGNDGNKIYFGTYGKDFSIEQYGF